MKFIIYIFLVFVVIFQSYAQINTDSLKNLINQARGEERVDLLNRYSADILYELTEVSFEFTKEALKLAQRLDYKVGEAEAYINMGGYYNVNYQDSTALEQFIKAYSICEEIDFKEGIVKALTRIGLSYYYLYDYENSLKYSELGLEIARTIKSRKDEASILQNIGNVYKAKSDYNKALEFYEKALNLFGELKDKSSTANALNAIGLIYFELNEFEKAIDYYKRRLIIQQELDDKRGRGITLHNIGNGYRELENYELAMKYFQDALTIFEETNYKLGIVFCTNNLGLINNDLGNLDKAIEFYRKSLEINEEINNKSAMADALNNIAYAYDSKVVDELRAKYGISWDDSLEVYRNDTINERLDTIANFYLKALEIRKSLNDTAKIATVLNNLGTLYYHKGDYIRSLDYFREALAINIKLNDLNETALNYIAIGRCYNYLNEYSKALNLLLENLEDAKNTNKNEILFMFYEQISKAYRGLRNYNKALEYNMLYTETKEKFLNEERLRQTAELNTKYETEKKEAQILILDQKNQLQETTIKKRNQVIIFFIAFIAIILVSAAMLLRLNRQIQKANIELEHKNEVITHQKEEITDSIKYARRIQRAVIPSPETANKILPEHFILFRPRDIVSGDFYWLSKQGSKVIIVAADCTGHGVPGAFMSMLGVSFLNEIVNKEEVVQANLILNELRTSVKTTLSQTGAEGEAKDGMDIALVILDLEKKVIQYAGAYNPLYLCRNGELLETKADKMPIGIYVKEKESFTNHEISIQKGDTFYIFSDGFIDQFGGSDRRKFMSKPFKELLTNIQDRPMADQREVLNRSIDEWRGEIPQIDDIILIGVRV